MLYINSIPSAWAYASYTEGRIGVFDVMVSPEQRSKGLGRGIMRCLMDWGRQKGAEEAYLMVEEGNLGARRLYEGFGFKDIYKYHYMRKYE